MTSSSAFLNTLSHVSPNASTAVLQLHNNKNGRAIGNRPQPNFVYCEPEGTNIDFQGFTAKPHEDIPKNRLTEKLVRGV